MAQYFASLRDGMVAEIVTLPDDIAPADAFTPAFTETLIKCSADVQQGWVFKGKKLVAPAPPARTIEQALSELAAIRWQHEVAGCDVILLGRSAPVRVATDRESQGKIGNALLAVIADLWVDGTAWKMADGEFVELTAADARAMALTAQIHVAACFAHEADLAAAITHDPATDLTTGWPG